MVWYLQLPASRIPHLLRRSCWGRSCAGYAHRFCLGIFHDPVHKSHSMRSLLVTLLYPFLHYFSIIKVWLPQWGFCACQCQSTNTVIVSYSRVKNGCHNFYDYKICICSTSKKSFLMRPSIKYFSSKGAFQDKLIHDISISNITRVLPPRCSIGSIQTWCVSTPLGGKL